MGCIVSCCFRFCCTPQQVALYCLTCKPPSAEYRGICQWPHGCCYSFMAIMSGFGGVYMNMYVLMSCFMQRIKLVNPVTGETIPGEERGYGFFARETDAGLDSDYQQCSFYEEDEVDVVFDTWVRSARFFTFVSEFLGILCFLVLMNTCWCAFSEETFTRWLFWLYLLAAGAIGLSFLIFGSEFCGDNRCKVAAGSGYAITTLMFWLSSCNTVKSIGGAMPKPPKDPNRPKRRRPWSRRNKSEDDEDIDQVMADLYYEDENDKYPIPECTPDGRKRYAAAAAYADDTDPANRRQQQEESDSDDDSDSDDSDSSDDSDDSEDSDEDGQKKDKKRDGLMYDKNAGRDGLVHDGNGGYADDGYGGNGYHDGYDPGAQGQEGIEMAEYNGQDGGAPGYDGYDQGQGYDGQYDQGAAPGYEGYDEGQYDQGAGYDQGQYDQGAAPGYEGNDQGQYDQGAGYDQDQYDQGAAPGYEGYDQGQYGNTPPGQEGYDPYAQPGYDQGGYDPQGYDPNGGYDPNATYAQPGYEQGGEYDQGTYGQPGYEQGGQDPDGMYDVNLQGGGYEEDGRRPQVGDADGPTIT